MKNKRKNALSTLNDLTFKNTLRKAYKTVPNGCPEKNTVVRLYGRFLISKLYNSTQKL